MKKKFVVLSLGFLTLAALTVPVPQTHAQEDSMAPTVLVTGSNRGLGFHFAQQFAQAGWNVIATARTPDKADDLKAVAEEHPNLIIEELDITDPNEIAALSKKYSDQPIDVLLNNAARLGEISRQNFGSIDFDLFREILETNVIGSMRVSEAFVENVAVSDQKKIIVMGSATGSNEIGHATPNFYAYRASKAALHFSSAHMAADFKDRGIAVVLLEPGFADSRGIMTMRPEDAPDQETRELVEMVQGSGAQMQSPAESVAAMIQVIDSVDIEKTGQFLLFDGSTVPY
jgi:NAD(P)-dependent dehydrogenase (short-subunit alcohol dehydrogenase family)